MRVSRSVVLRAGIYVGEIAATAAGDENLPTDFWAVIDQADAPPSCARRHRTHHAGAACADDNHVEFVHPTKYISRAACMRCSHLPQNCVGTPHGFARISKPCTGGNLRSTWDFPLDY